MQIVIAGHDLPGTEFVSDGVLLHNVHVAVQVGKEPVGLTRGDADSARWEIDVRAVLAGSEVDLRGPAVHGKKGERFLYLTWGDVDPDNSFAMFRRAKLMIGDIEPEMLAAAARDDGVLVASLTLTDEQECPRCARIKPPLVRWRPGAERRDLWLDAAPRSRNVGRRRGLFGLVGDVGGANDAKDRTAARLQSQSTVMRKGI